MPKVLVIGRFVFLLFASDVAEARRHIHVEVKKGCRSGKSRGKLNEARRHIHVEVKKGGGAGMLRSAVSSPCSSSSRTAT